MSRFSILAVSFALSISPAFGVAQAKPAKPASASSACATGQRLFNVTFTLSNPAVTTAGPDFYDISIINGINLAVSMGPVTGTFQPTAGNPYSCGTPGSATASGKLSGCPWTIQPTVAGVDQTALLRNILPQTLKTCPNSANTPNSLGYCPCAKDSDCSSANLVCGAAMNASSTQKFAQVCGTQIAWWTADQICGASIGTSTPFGAPLNCASTVTNSDNRPAPIQTFISARSRAARPTPSRRSLATATAPSWTAAAAPPARPLRCPKTGRRCSAPRSPARTTAASTTIRIGTRSPSPGWSSSSGPARRPIHILSTTPPAPSPAPAARAIRRPIT